MIKLIIFDVDGVLVDSKRANIAFFQKLLKKAGCPIPSKEEILDCFHLPLWQAIEKLTAIKDQKEIKRIWDYAQNGSLRDPSLFSFPEQLESTLKSLHSKYKLAIVTSRVKAGMDDVFSAVDIRYLFDGIVTFEDYKKPKPDPEPLLVILKRLSITPSEAVYIGDSESDILSAKAAGIKSIHLSASKHKYATEGIAEFHKLISAIERINY